MDSRVISDNVPNRGEAAVADPLSTCKRDPGSACLQENRRPCMSSNGTVQGGRGVVVPRLCNSSCSNSWDLDLSHFH